MRGLITLYILLCIIYAMFKSIELHIDKKIEINVTDIFLLPSIPIALLLLLILKITDRNE